MKHILKEDNIQAFFREFPHIGKRVELFWGEPESRGYLHSLISETRGDSRQGFPAHFFPVILQLIESHDLEFPKFIPKKDLWDLI